MTDLGDLKLDKSTVEPETSGRSRNVQWRAMSVGALIAVAAMGYVALRRSAPPEPARATDEPTVAPSEPAPDLRPEPGEDIVLPRLDETYVRWRADCGRRDWLYSASLPAATSSARGSS